MDPPDMPCIHKRGQQQWVSENNYRSHIDCGFDRSIPSDAISGTKFSRYRSFDGNEASCSDSH